MRWNYSRQILDFNNKSSDIFEKDSLNLVCFDSLSLKCTYGMFVKVNLSADSFLLTRRICQIYIQLGGKHQACLLKVLRVVFLSLRKSLSH